MTKISGKTIMNGMSIYEMNGKIIIRRKGGPTSKQVKKSPRFELPRQNGKEFGTCAKAGATIRRALIQVAHVADYNITPALNSLCKSIQRLDTVSLRGQRAINFSQHGDLLESFNYNKLHPFDSVVRHSLQCTIDRAKGTAVVQLPDLRPGINLRIPWKQPLFRITITLGVVGDWIYSGDDYKAPDGMGSLYVQPVNTPWHLLKQNYTGQRVELRLNNPEALDDTKTLLLAVGLEMGTPGAGNSTDIVKKTGCAKIVAVG